MDLIRNQLSSLGPNELTFVRHVARAELTVSFGKTAKQIEALELAAEHLQAESTHMFGKVKVRFWINGNVWMIDYRVDNVEFTLMLCELYRLHRRPAVDDTGDTLKLCASEAAANGQRVFVDDACEDFNVRIYGFDSGALQPLWDALRAWHRFEKIISEL